jgi:hypothetical protein
MTRVSTFELGNDVLILRVNHAQEDEFFGRLMGIKTALERTLRRFYFLAQTEVERCIARFARSITPQKAVRGDDRHEKRKSKRPSGVLNHARFGR